MPSRTTDQKSEPLITATDLVFDYDTVRALSGVSFAIEPGTVVGLVGPNGAGKTTLMRCICALDAPSGGAVRVGGLDVRDNPRDIHRMIGFLPDFFGLYDDLTIRQALLFHAGAKKLPKDRFETHLAWAAKLIGLDMQLEKRIGTLSRGNRQKVAIAQAIIHRPQIAMLDEPASGLDPDARRQLSATIKLLNDEGMTLIVSSHILSELEDYCSHVMIVRDGKLDAFRPVGQENQRTGAASWQVTLARPDPRLMQVLGDMETVDILDASDREASFIVAGAETERHTILRDLIEAGLAVSQFSPLSSTMSDVYFSQTKPGDQP